jgi:hypothetical protein
MSLLCVVWMAACSSTAATPTFAATAVASSTPSPVPPTSTVPQLTVTGAAVSFFCRVGPATGYGSVDLIIAGQTATITGKNSDGTWWYVQDPKNPAKLCWVAGEAVTTSGDLSNLPVVPVPFGVVTDVKVVTATVTFKGCQLPNPVNLSGTITVNGPGDVTYHWLLGGLTSPDKTAHFTGAGTRTFGTSFEELSCGQFSAALRTVTPNMVGGGITYQVGP